LSTKKSLYALKNRQKTYPGEKPVTKPAPHPSAGRRAHIINQSASDQSASDQPASKQ